MNKIPKLTVVGAILTEEMNERVQRYLFKLGYAWSDGQNITPIYPLYQTEFAIRIGRNEGKLECGLPNRGLGFGTVSFYEREGYTIISPEQLFLWGRGKQSKLIDEDS